MRIRDIPDAVKVLGKVWIYLAPSLGLLPLSRIEGRLIGIEGTIGKGFKRLERAIDKGFKSLSASNPHNPRHLPELEEPEEEEEKKEPERKPTGAGAFGGMIVGDALGLPFGPLGIFIGGILGALIGNQIEYESIKKGRAKSKD